MLRLLGPFRRPSFSPLCHIRPENRGFRGVTGEAKERNKRLSKKARFYRDCTKQVVFVKRALT